MKRSSTIKMTARAIENLRGPSPGSSSSNREYTASQQKNLVLAVFPNGSKSWRLKVKLRGRRISYTFGAYPTWSVDQAIERARELLRLVDLGIDPRYGPQTETQMTGREFIEQHFRAHVEAHYKSASNAINMLEKRILPHFGGKELKEVTKKDIAAFHRDLANEVSGTTANRYLSLLSSLFKFAIELEVADANPCHGIRKAPENKSRDRFLHDDEFARFIQALENNLDNPSCQALYLLCALGVRKSELLGLRWENINLSDGTLYLCDTKNGESRYVAVNTVAKDLLTRMHQKRRRSCPWVFPSKASASGHLVDLRHQFKKVCTMAEIVNFRPHDARRTHASQLINAGQDVLVVKEVLGHKSLRSTQVYARVSITSQARASEIVATKIKGALNG